MIASSMAAIRSVKAAMSALEACNNKVSLKVFRCCVWKCVTDVAEAYFRSRYTMTSWRMLDLWRIWWRLLTCKPFFIFLLPNWDHCQVRP